MVGRDGAPVPDALALVTVVEHLYGGERKLVRSGGRIRRRAVAAERLAVAANRPQTRTKGTTVVEKFPRLAEVRALQLACQV